MSIYWGHGFVVGRSSPVLFLQPWLDCSFLELMWSELCRPCLKWSTESFPVPDVGLKPKPTAARGVVTLAFCALFCVGNRNILYKVSRGKNESNTLMEAAQIHPVFALELYLIPLSAWTLCIILYESGSKGVQ